MAPQVPRSELCVAALAALCWDVALLIHYY